jgi:hypothetical protein
MEFRRALHNEKEAKRKNLIKRTLAAFFLLLFIWFLYLGSMPVQKDKPITCALGEGDICIDSVMSSYPSWQNSSENPSNVGSIYKYSSLSSYRFNHTCTHKHTQRSPLHFKEKDPQLTAAEEKIKMLTEAVLDLKEKLEAGKMQVLEEMIASMEAEEERQKEMQRQALEQEKKRRERELEDKKQKEKKENKKSGGFFSSFF